MGKVFAYRWVYLVETLRSFSESLKPVLFGAVMGAASNGKMALTAGLLAAAGMLELIEFALAYWRDREANQLWLDSQNELVEKSGAGDELVTKAQALTSLTDWYEISVPAILRSLTILVSVPVSIGATYGWTFGLLLAAVAFPVATYMAAIGRVFIRCGRKSQQGWRLRHKALLVERSKRHWKAVGRKMVAAYMLRTKLSEGVVLLSNIYVMVATAVVAALLGADAAAMAAVLAGLRAVDSAACMLGMEVGNSLQQIGRLQEMEK